MKSLSLFKKISAFVILCALIHCFGSPNSGNTQPPQGCQKTMCDLEYASCKNPTCVDQCSECLDRCSKLDLDYRSACYDVCDRPCKNGKTASCPTPCEDQLEACRQTERNAICADIIFNQQSNPPCQTCVSELYKTCAPKACAKEGQALAKAIEETHCTTDDCLASQKPEIFHALVACFLTAIQNPKDNLGCYSGATRCLQSVCKSQISTAQDAGPSDTISRDASYASDAKTSYASDAKN